LYLWITAAQNPEFQATPEGAAMLRTLRLHEICPDGERKKFGSCYTLNPWTRTQPLDQGDERTDLLQPSHLVEARRLCEDAAKSRAIFIAKAKSLYEGNSQIKQQVQAERRAEFINWARTTFEESRAAGGRGRGHPEAEAHQQITYHDASVCPVMSESTPAISEFSLDQCSFLADWFHRWDRNKDGLLDACEIGSMFHCLRIPIGPGALEAIMQYFDEDMDGKLSFREFLLMWRAALHDPDFRRTAEGCKMAKQMRIHNLLPNRGKAAWPGDPLRAVEMDAMEGTLEEDTERQTWLLRNGGAQVGTRRRQCVCRGYDATPLECADRR
ncbi:hypothetical protein HPB47_001037, partial [Ixodes persulcatus]